MGRRLRITLPLSSPAACFLLSFLRLVDSHPKARSNLPLNSLFFYTVPAAVPGEFFASLLLYDSYLSSIRDFSPYSLSLFCLPSHLSSFFFICEMRYVYLRSIFTSHYRYRKIDISENLKFKIFFRERSLLIKKKHVDSFKVKLDKKISARCCARSIQYFFPGAMTLTCGNLQCSFIRYSPTRLFLCKITHFSETIAIVPAEKTDFHTTPLCKFLLKVTTVERDIERRCGIERG